MKKEDILRILNEYNFDKEEFMILSGAALVIFDVKNSTDDIDIAVSSKMYDYLLNNFNCQFEKEADNYKVWFIDGVINFSKHYYNDFEFVYYNGYKIQSLDSVLRLKQKLNREKDKNDIERIIKYLKK